MRDDDYILACIEYADYERLACAEDAKADYAALRTRLAAAESALAGIERTLRYAGDLRRDQSVDLANDLRDIRAALLRQGAAAGEGER